MPKTYPDVGTFTSGQILTAAKMNEIGDNLDNQRIPAMWRLKKTANQSVNNSTDTLVTWDTAETAPAFDTDGVFNGAVSSSEVTIQTTGVYMLTVEVDFAGNNTGRRSVFITRNGTAYSNAIAVANHETSPAGEFACLTSGIFSLTAADVLRVYVFQNCGVALNILAGSAPGNVSTHFAGCWLGQLT